MQGRGGRGGRQPQGLGPGVPPPDADPAPMYLWAVRSLETWLRASPWCEEAANSGFSRSSRAAGWMTSSATCDLGRGEGKTKAQKCSQKFSVCLNSTFYVDRERGRKRGVCCYSKCGPQVALAQEGFVKSKETQGKFRSLQSDLRE